MTFQCTVKLFIFADGLEESNKEQCECLVLSTREDLTFTAAILGLLGGRERLERLVNVIDKITSPVRLPHAPLG